MMRRRLVPHALGWLAMLLAAAAAWAAPLPVGESETPLEVGETTIVAYAYKPASYRGGPLLLVLHGLGRNAPGYRDYARPLADRYGFLVVAPLFDRERFPAWRYQTGGIARDTGDGRLQAQPDGAWIGATLHGIVDAIRDIEAAPALPYALIGHSAGAQALSRYAAYAISDARHIVVANPSTYLWPSGDIRYPYGLAGLSSTLADDAMLKRYLAQPLTVLLGTADVKRDRDLNVKPGAMAQGANRYERGIRFFRTGERIARERGWPFGWRLVEVPGVGHSARRMLGSEEAASVFDD